MYIMSNRLGLKLSAAPTEASAAAGGTAAEAACMVVMVVIISGNRHHGCVRIREGILIRPQVTAVFLQIGSAVRKGMHVFARLPHAHNRNPCNHRRKNCRKQHKHRNATAARNWIFREKRINGTAVRAVILIIRTKRIHIPPELLHRRNSR